MRDVLPEIVRWYSAGEPFALATVVSTFRDAPRPPGAVMAVSASGETAGSVSGGCVESAVYELAREAMAWGEPAVETYGVSDEAAFAAGLTSGGIIDVFVEPVPPGGFPQLPRLVESLDAGKRVATATVIDGPRRLGARLVIWPHGVAGTLGSVRLDAAVADDARGILEAGTAGVLRYGPNGERHGGDLSVFVSTMSGRLCRDRRRAPRRAMWTPSTF